MAIPHIEISIVDLERLDQLEKFIEILNALEFPDSAEITTVGLKSVTAKATLPQISIPVWLDEHGDQAKDS